MFRKLKVGKTSVMLPVRIYDSSSTTGAYLGSLTFASSGLVGKYRRQGDSAWTSITIVTATAGTFTSGGFAVPTSAPTGSYELHIPNAAFAAGAEWVEIEYSGVTNMLPVQVLIELDAVDYQDAVRFGLTGLPNAAAGVVGGLPLSVDTSGRVDCLKINGTSQTARDIGASVIVATNNDKTGYSLTATTGLGNQTANITGNLSGSVGSVTGNVGGNVTGTVTLATSQPNYAPSKAGDAMALTSGERTTLAASIWNALTSGLTTVSSIGKLLVDNVNATISSRSTYAGGDTSGTTTLLSRIVGTIATGTHNPQSGDAYARLGAPTGASIAADIQTRLATSGYAAPLDAAGVRTAVGLASANLDTQLSAINTKTTNLPVDPADASDIAAAFSTVNSTLSTVLALIDTEIAAIKAKTDGLPADTAASLTTLAGYVDTLETELAKVLKTGEQFTATDGTGSKNVTFTRF